MAENGLPNSYTELGFQIKHFKFALRIPKLKRPKLLRRRRQQIVAVTEKPVDWASEIHDRYQEELRRYNKQKTTSTAASTESSTESYDWIRDFHTRYNPVAEPVAVQAVPDATIISNNPERTSTPFSLTIQPLNRMLRQNSDVQAQTKLDFLDMSGLKIYEDLEESEEDFLDSHGSSEQDSSELSDQSYEIVSVVDHRVIAKATFKPRTLKSSGGGTLRRANLV